MAQDDPTVLDAMAVVVRYVLRDHRGVRIGQVVKYDAARRTADVQPFRRRRARGVVFDEPPVVDAPVGTWRLGGMVLAGELEPGDEVLIVTCEREIRPWWLGGKAHDPQSRRMHAAEDSVILPWISNLKRTITAQPSGTLYLGREDATAGITITRGPLPGTTTIEGTGTGSIKLGSGAVDAAVLGTTLAAAVGTPVLPASVAGILTAVPAAIDPATVITLANANKSAILAICAAVNAALATKTVVE